MEEEQQQETNSATTVSSFPKENNDDGEKKNKISNEEAMQKSEKALDDAIYYVLRDLELVWHNCFTYNEEGSAIYQMAQVQRRKCQMIRISCIDAFLPEDVKKRIDDYAATCEKKRMEKTAQEPQSSLLISKGSTKRRRASGKQCGDVDTAHQASGMDENTNKRHQIEVRMSYGGTSHAVGVFNTKTNMIVQKYTTLNNACKACCYINQELGYDAEICIKEHNVKQTVRSSSADPSQTLFGFWGTAGCLWVIIVVTPPPISSLLGPKKEFTLVERIRKDWQEFYVSIHEAYQSVAVDKPKEPVTLKDFRQKLDGEIAECISCKWRILRRGDETAASTTTGGCDFGEAENNDADTKISGEGSSLVSLPVVQEEEPTTVGFSLGGNGYFLEDGLETTLSTSNIIIYKEDIMSGAMLGGFETLGAAYQHWLNTCKGAIVAPTDSGDVTFFREHYANGYRTVDAIQWKPVPPLSPSSLDKRKGGNRAMTDRYHVDPDDEQDDTLYVYIR